MAGAVVECPIRGAAQGRDRAALLEPAQCRETPGDLRLRGLRAAAVFLRHQIRERHRLAEASLETVAAQLKAPIHTEIVAAGPFYKAEDYHQDYYLKNPARYKFYRWNCGRDRRLEEIWGKSNKSS